jgi:hypothetical protein
MRHQGCHKNWKSGKSGNYKLVAEVMDKSSSLILGKGKVEQIDSEWMELCFLLRIMYCILIGQQQNKKMPRLMTKCLATYTFAVTVT